MRSIRQEAGDGLLSRGRVTHPVFCQGQQLVPGASPGQVNEPAGVQSTENCYISLKINDGFQGPEGLDAKEDRGLTTLQGVYSEFTW